ncbi:TetR/AcrR family transcriptional regulator [Mycobacteroides abscessus]|uniref:TetR/AcrR family transcriptional regulator n=1 Tax=Mycobacteroides abscessus TaxID=36809 RepID=UPI001F1BB943|nr:TetR/AcrR family transcriptional regulator [Mycobacteroides abscessus]
MPPRRRVDAQRNRDKILAAAKGAFANPDADVSMAEIARRAGIGSATLYRNFPDRRALLEAVYRDEIDLVCQAAASCNGTTAGEKLHWWLRCFYDYFLSKRVLAGELLEHTDSDSTVFREGFARIVTVAESLTNAARTSGELRGDLTVDQILALVASVANIPGDPAYREPILNASLDGLRTLRSRE